MLYLAARQMEFASAWSAIADATWWVLIPFFGVMCIQHLFRAWRWQYLLAPIEPVPFLRLLPIASVGFFAIIALPLRMGEFVRPYLIASPPRLRMTHALGTLVVERVFDGLFLALTSFLAVLWSSTEAPLWVRFAGMFSLALFLGALVIILLLFWQRERATLLVQRLFSPISPNLASRLGKITQGILDGLKVIPDIRRIGCFLFGSLMYWSLNAVSIWILASGFALGLGTMESLAVLGLIGVGIMVPAGPGFIGNFELFADGALRLYLPTNVVNSRGGAFILAFHAANAFWYVLAGTLAFFSPHVSWDHVWKASTDVEQH